MESLEITIKSASCLKDSNTIGTMDPYVLVTLFSNPKSVQKTDVALFGGTNPKWRSKTMRFAVNEDLCKKQNVILVFKIMAEKTLGDKEVGEVVLLVKELLQVEQTEKSLSCTVTTPSGRPKGTLHFSYKFLKNGSSYKAVSERNVSGDYAAPKAIRSYGTDLYPPSPPHPQPLKEVDVPNPPPSPPPHNPQPAGYYYYPPPHLQQEYAPPPPRPPPHYQQPVGYYPPPLQGWPHAQYYANQNYTYAPAVSGHPSASGSQQVQVKEVGGKKTKSKKGGWLAAVGTGAATLLLGDVGASLMEASGLGGATDYAGSVYPAAGAYYNFDFTDHYSSIGSAIG